MQIDRRNLVKYGGTGLLTAAILLALVGSGYALIRGNSPADAMFESIRRLPVIGLVIADNADVASRLRKAIEEETLKPSSPGLSRPYALVAELRRQYVVPALRAAADETAVAALAARANLVRHLRGTDVAACRAFATDTLQRPGTLDPEGRRLYGAWQAAVETAYRSGKSGKPLPVPTRSEVVTILQDAGFKKVDFDRLNAFRHLSNEASCEVELMVDSLPPNLPAEKRGPFARYVLTN